MYRVSVWVCVCVCVSVFENVYIQPLVCSVVWYEAKNLKSYYTFAVSNCCWLLACLPWVLFRCCTYLLLNSAIDVCASEWTRKPFGHHWNVGAQEVLMQDVAPMWHTFTVYGMFNPTKQKLYEWMNNIIGWVL